MKKDLNTVSTYSQTNPLIGVLKFEGGEYEGELLDGKAYGEGVYTKNGTTWTGTFLNNQFHGYCKFYISLLNLF